MELTNTQKDLSAACTASEDFQQQIEGLQRQFAGLRQENCQASEHVHELKAIRVDLKAELRVSLHGFTNIRQPGQQSTELGRTPCRSVMKLPRS